MQWLKGKQRYLVERRNKNHFIQTQLIIANCTDIQQVRIEYPSKNSTYLRYILRDKSKKTFRRLEGV